MTSSLARDPNTYSNEELERLVASRRSAIVRGDSGALPERGSEAVGFASAATKSYGIEAAEHGMNGSSYSYYESWKNPMRMPHGRFNRELMTKSLHQVGYAPHRGFSSFGDFIRKGYTGHRSAEFQAQHKAPFEKIPAVYKAARGMSTLNGAEGGYLVQPEFSPTIEEMIFENDIADRIRMLPFNGPIVKIPRSTDSDRRDGKRSSGAYAVWLDQAKRIPEAKMTVDFCRLEMKKLAIIVFLTAEILEDSEVGIEKWVKAKIQEEFNFQVARTIFWGQGGAEPIGFAKSSNKVIVPPTGTQGVDSLVARNFQDMMSRHLSLPGAKPLFLYNRTCTPAIGSLDIQQYPVMVNINDGGFSAKPLTTIQGVQSEPNELCAVLGDEGDVWLVDLNQYVAINRKTIREDMSIHVEFLTDQQAIRVIIGFDGAPLHDSPVQPYQAGSTLPPTLAPFVTVGAR